MNEWILLICCSMSFFCTAILRNIMNDRMLQPRGLAALYILYFSCFVNVVAIWAIPIFAFYTTGFWGGVVVFVGSVIITSIINGAFFKGQAAYQVVVVITILNASIFYFNVSPSGRSYEDCILENMPSTKTKIASAEIRRACYKKFNHQSAM